MTTTQDFDRLSAYLDDQLAPRDRAALEARLAAEPDLRASLNDLRLTVRALRALPAVKLPRSFTLSPAQVGARVAQRRAPLFPVLRFATALSAVALAVVLAGDLGGGFLATSTNDFTGGGEAEVASVMVTDMVEEAAPAEAPAPSETPAAEMDTMGGGSGDGSAGTDEALDTQAAVEATQAVAMVMPEVAVTPTPTGAADRTMAPTAEPSPKSLEPTLTPPVVANVPPSATDDLYYSADTDPGQTQVAEQSRQGPSTLRVIELALVMLTVLLGAAAWFTRRNG